MVFPRYLAGFRLGSLLAGYRLEAQVGAGGMAVVFRARDERLNRLVALKILTPALADDSAFRQRFIAESRAAAAVDDPYIIPIYEAGETDGVLFIAMRFVQGGDLRRVLQHEGALPAERAAEFISPVASALDAANAVGLVHRDVKPGNILVDAHLGRPDHVYLSDFGVSKGAVTAMSLTGASDFIGTPDYSSPEQIQGPRVDGRADQYSLACVTYELLTGAVPFERDRAMAVMMAHLSAPPPELAERRPDLPSQAGQVLVRGMAKDPDARYGSCGDFADALRDALGLPPYHARGSPTPPPQRSPAPPSPLAALAPSTPAAPPDEMGPATIDSRPGGGPAEMDETPAQASPAEPDREPGAERPPAPTPTVVVGGETPAPAEAGRPPAADLGPPAPDLAGPAEVTGIPGQVPPEQAPPEPDQPDREDGGGLQPDAVPAPPTADLAASAEPVPVTRPREQAGPKSARDAARPARPARAPATSRPGTVTARLARFRLPAIAVASAAIAAAVTIPFVLHGTAKTPSHGPAPSTAPAGPVNAPGAASYSWADAPAYRRAGLDLPPAYLVSGVSSLAFSPAGAKLAIADGGAICLWDVAAATCAARFPKAYSVAFNPGGTVLAAGDDNSGSNFSNGVVKLWHVATGKLTSTVTNPHSLGAYSVAFGPGGTMAVGDDNGHTYLWNVTTRKLAATLSDPGTGGVYSVAFGAGTTLAVGDDNGHTYLWNVGTRKLAATLAGPHRKGIASVAFSVGGKTLATGDQGGQIRLWSLATRKLAATLTDPGSKGIESVAFSPDGTAVAAGDANGRTYLWNVATGKLTATLTDPHSGGIAAVAFSPSGKALVTGDQNGRVSFWYKAARLSAGPGKLSGQHDAGPLSVGPCTLTC